MKHYLKLLVAMLLVLTCVQAKQAQQAEPPPQLRVVFAAYDMSEALDMLRMRRQLLAKFPNALVTFLSFGPCRELLLQENPEPYISLCSILPVEFYNLQDDPEVSRALKYSPKLVQEVVTKTPADFIITGMSSRIQEQLVRQYKAAGAKVITYYDSFAWPINKSGKTVKYIKPFMKFVGDIDTMMVTANVLKSSFKSHNVAKQATAYVVGKPSLAKWQEHYDMVWTGKLRKKYKITAKKVVLFDGDNSESYNQSFINFVAAAKQIPSIQFLVTYPADAPTKGDYERKIIENHGAENIQVIPYEPDIAVDLSKISDLMVLHKSQLGPAALSVGLPVIYIAKDGYNNFAIEQGFADRVYEEEAILRTIRSKILKGRTRSSRISKQVPINGFISFLNYYDGFKPYQSKTVEENEKESSNGVNTVKHGPAGQPSA